MDAKRMNESYGRFAWIYDSDGNKIELWQPPPAKPRGAPSTHLLNRFLRSYGPVVVEWRKCACSSQYPHRPKSYGFRTYRVLELALYHSLGKLQAESTHDFF